MINKSTTTKKSVALAADAPEPGSRIRRQPDGPAPGERQSLISRIDWGSREWEIRLATAGIVFFALAIAAVVVDVGELISR